MRTNFIILKCLTLSVPFGCADDQPGGSSDMGSKDQGDVFFPSDMGTRDAGSLPRRETIEEISMAQDLACIRWNNSEVQCWGDDSGSLDWQTLRLQGDLEVVRRVVCGLGTSGIPECISSSYNYSDVMFASFGSVRPGPGSLCGLNHSGEIECPFISPGWEGRHQNIPEGPFETLEVARGDYVCGMTEEEEWRCDGDTDFNKLPPEDRFEKVSLGTGLHCGLKQDGSIRCWGTMPIGPIPMFTGSFSDLDTSGFEGCGVKTGGALECIGNFVPDTSKAEGIQFRRITVTDSTACGVVGDDKVFCFGPRISSPPDDIAYVP